MRNTEETHQLLELQKRIMAESDMIGWLCTVHRNKVHYDKNPDAAKMIQGQLDKASNLISLAYIWAILDEQGFNETNRWITEKDRLELKAWKHIRHTGAHAPNGRAQRYFDEFNEFMASDYPGLSGLKKNCTYTDNSIDLVDFMNFRFFQYVQHLISQAIGFCANDRDPDSEL